MISFHSVSLITTKKTPANQAYLFASACQSVPVCACVCECVHVCGVYVCVSVI